MRRLKLETLIEGQFLTPTLACFKKLFVLTGRQSLDAHFLAFNHQVGREDHLMNGPKQRLS